MAKRKMPAPRRAGTRSKDTTQQSRAQREEVVAKKLEELSETNPAAFDRMMKLLAELIVETERAKN